MKKWESILVGPHTTLETAIAVLDRGALRIAIVIDEDRRLLGTLTDGDVRRAMLSHIPIDIPVNRVMCTTPQVAQRNWSHDRILAVMKSMQLLQLPIVDENNRIVGLANLHDLLGKHPLDNLVFLMAGGFGKRLYPLTQECPKPLLKVGTKPILEIILESFIKAGFHRFFISTHYMNEKVREHFGDGQRWGVSIRYTHEKTPLGTGGAIGLLPHDEINEPMLMMNGDLLTTLNYRDLLDFHHQHSGAATMCVREFEYQVPYGVIKSDGIKAKSIIEKPIQKFFVNAGIYVLSPEIVKNISSNTSIDMPTVLDNAMIRGQDVTIFPIHEYWLDIGRMEDFQRAQIDFGNIFK